MAQIDLDINRNVRRVMVRHWVDLGRLRLSSANGRISIRGSLLKIPGQGSLDFLSVNVDQIFSELKRIQNVKWVHVELENWTDATGAWLPVGQQKSSSKAVQESAQTTTFEITKET